MLAVFRLHRGRGLYDYQGKIASGSAGDSVSDDGLTRSILFLLRWVFSTIVPIPPITDREPNLYPMEDGYASSPTARVCMRCHWDPEGWGCFSCFGVLSFDGTEGQVWTMQVEERERQ